jgi:hypothetical protein
MALHNAQEFDDHFGGRADENLAFAATFGIDYVGLQHHITLVPAFHLMGRGGHTRQSFYKHQKDL